MNGQRRLGRLLVAWGHRDVLHVIGPRLRLHVFVWTRGARLNPLYVRLGRS